MSKGSTMKKGYAKLKLGMSREEVIAIFGRPDAQRVKNGVETLKWEVQEWKGFLRGGRMTRSVEVEFEDGKLIGYDGENINVTTW
jgi:hypothetical protein